MACVAAFAVLVLLLTLPAAVALAAALALALAAVLALAAAVAAATAGVRAPVVVAMLGSGVWAEAVQTSQPQSWGGEPQAESSPVSDLHRVGWTRQAERMGMGWCIPSSG